MASPSAAISSDQSNACEEITSTSNATFKCQECSKQFSHYTSLKRHMNTHINQQVHECVTCLHKFTRKDSLLKHINSGTCKSLEDRKENLACSICKKVFSRSYNLKRHVMDVHNKDRVKYTCNVDGCQMVYSREDKYRLHQLTHSGVDKVQVRGRKSSGRRFVPKRSSADLRHSKYYDNQDLGLALSNSCSMDIDFTEEETTDTFSMVFHSTVLEVYSLLLLETSFMAYSFSEVTSYCWHEHNIFFCIIYNLLFSGASRA